MMFPSPAPLQWQVARGFSLEEDRQAFRSILARLFGGAALTPGTRLLHEIQRPDLCRDRQDRQAQGAGMVIGGG